MSRPQPPVQPDLTEQHHPDSPLHTPPANRSSVADGVEFKEKNFTPLNAEAVNSAGLKREALQLELLAEKAQVQVEKYLKGEVKIHKIIREKTVQIPVTLREEVLVISYQPAVEKPASTPAGNTVTLPCQPVVIQINGETVQLMENQSLDIVLSHEQAQVTKKIYVVEQVDIGKTTKTTDQQVTVTLQHEELDIQQTSLDSNAPPKLLQE